VISDVSEKRDALILEDEAVAEESKSHILPLLLQANKIQPTKHDTTDHKSHFLSGANCYMFRQQGAIVRQFINNNVP